MFFLSPSSFLVCYAAFNSFWILNCYLFRLCAADSLIFSLNQFKFTSQQENYVFKGHQNLLHKRVFYLEWHILREKNVESCLTLKQTFEKTQYKFKKYSVKVGKIVLQSFRLFKKTSTWKKLTKVTVIFIKSL